MSELALVAEGTHVEQFFGNWIVKDEIAVEESVVGLVYGRDEREKWDREKIASSSLQDCYAKAFLHP